MVATIRGAVARVCVSGAVSFLILPTVLGAAPPISGTPPAEVRVGQPYVFKPTASIQAAPPPRFAIVNKPRWAVFSTQYGWLAGVPAAADAGTYANIRVFLITSRVIGEIPAFSITVRSAQSAPAVSLSWTAPMENEDGSALTNLAGYRLYSGPAPDQLEQLVALPLGLTRHVIEGLPPGRHFFALSAVTTAGAESELSKIVTTLVP
jgi:hypothetical protein